MVTQDIFPSEITFNYIKHMSKHPVRRWMINSFYDEMLKLLKEINFSSVLDAGCGEGFTLDRLHKSNFSKDLVGVDSSESAIKLGKKLFPSLNLKVGDIYNLPFKDGSKDLVVCTEVLEHLTDPRKALKELVRVSKKYLILSVPNEPYFSLKNFIIGRNIRRFGSSKGHLNRWTSEAFEKFVRQEPIKILKNKHPFPFTLLLLELQDQ